MAKVHNVTPEEIKALMDTGLTREEAEFKLIDKYDEVIFPDEDENIIAEVKKNLKVANVYDKKKGKVKKERKPNENKRYIVDILYKAVGDFDGVVLTNCEGKIDFSYNGKNYTITLTEHRK